MVIAVSDHLQKYMGDVMFRTLVCVSFLCFGCLTAADQAAAQATASFGDCGTSACSTGCGTGCNTGCASACDTGCGGLAGCGRMGGFFKRGGDCCGCGDQSCGGGCGRGGALGSRVKGLIPQFDLTFGRNPCPQRYRSFWAGGFDLNSYEGVDGGGNPVRGTFNEGYMFGTAKGQYLNDCTRFEIEGSWRNNTGDLWVIPGAAGQLDGKINVYSTMANLVREFNLGPLKCYGGGGIGFSRQDGEFTFFGNQFDLEDWAFAYQGFAGLNVIDNQRMTVYGEYRYFANTETDINVNNVFFDNFNYETHNILFGIRFKR